MSTVKEITREEVLAAKDNLKATHSLESRARALYLKSVEVGEGATVAAAYAAYAWERWGAGPSGTKTQTAKAWGETFKTGRQKMDRKTGKMVDVTLSESMVSLLRVLGVALVEKNIDPKSELFRDLAFNGAQATRADVKKAILDPKKDTTAISREVTKAQRLAKKKATTKATDGTPSDGSENPVVLIKKAVDLIKKSAVGLSRDDFAAIDEQVRDLYSGIVAERMEAEKKAANKRTAKRSTRKTAAPKPQAPAADTQPAAATA